MTDTTRTLVFAGTAFALVASGILLTIRPPGSSDTPSSQPVFGAGLPPDASLSRTSHCYPWAGGSAPSGTVWYADLVSTDTDDDKATLQVTAATDAGVLHPYEDRMFALEVGIVPGDAGVLEIHDLVRFLRNHGVHEVDPRYRCKIGAAGCPATAAHPECEVWATRYADPGVPALCMCGSGCQTSPNGTTWTALPAGQVSGRPYGFLVRSSGSGNCVAVPCGLLEGDEHALDNICN